MDRYPYAKPPRWWSSKPSRFWMRVWRMYRKWEERATYRIVRVDVRGLDRVKAAIGRGEGVLVTPNHAGHADSHLLYDALERLPLAPHVMTAWQVFALLPLHQRMIYRQYGCFSVNREANDLTAFRWSVRVLEKSSSPLVIFPEGEVYHLNDRVTDFREGTMTIAMAVVRRSGRPVSCFPCALKYFYVGDPTGELAAVMDRLEARVGPAVARGESLAARLARFLPAAIGLRERQFLGAEQAGPVETRIGRLAEAILARTEARLAIAPQSDFLPERVKAIRQAVIAKNEETHRRSESYSAGGADWRRPGSADDPLEAAFVAVQLYSYRPDYVAARPTIERIAETIDKYEEDFLGVRTATVRGVRRGVIAFGEPLVIREAGSREDGRRLGVELRDRVQALIDEMS